MKRIALCVAVLFLGGCTHYMYEGRIMAPDNEGMERNVLVYWNRTDPWIGKDKAGPIVVHTQCGSMIMFDETPSGIVFRGEAGRDVRAGSRAPIDDGAVCGEVVGARHIAEMREGTLALRIDCVPAPADDHGFSVAKRSYMKARQAAYDFPVEVDRSRSLIGKRPEAPSPPVCND